MVLEKLLLKRFKVEKIEGDIKVTQSPEGKYRATTSEEVHEALTTSNYTEVDVLIGNTWRQIRGSYKSRGFIKPPHNPEYYSGYRAGYNKAKSELK